MLILRVALYVMFGAVVGLAAGTPALAAAEAASGPQDALHEVMVGDNLHLIAGYYYGDARMWERIWAANKAQVKNPNVIERGMLLLIPNASVPDTPYPEFAARTRREAAAKAAAARAEAAPPEKEVRVMGESTPAAPAGGTTPPAGTPAASPAPPAGPAAPAPGAPPPAKAQPRPPAS